MPDDEVLSDVDIARLTTDDAVKLTAEEMELLDPELAALLNALPIDNARPKAQS